MRSATKHIQCSWDKVDVFNVMMLIKVMTKVFSKAGGRIIQVLSLCYTHMASAWALDIFEILIRRKYFDTSRVKIEKDISLDYHKSVN